MSNERKGVGGLVVIGVIFALGIGGGITFTIMGQKRAHKTKEVQETARQLAIEFDTQPDRKRLAEMQLEARKCIEYLSADGSLWLLYARISFLIGEYDETIAAASLSIDLSSTPAEGFWVRAQALEKQGHVNKALIDVARALELGLADKDAANAMKKRLVNALPEE